jgi:hypothetical protein
MCLGLGSDVGSGTRKDEETVDLWCDPSGEFLKADVPGFVFGQAEFQLADQVLFLFLIAAAQRHVQGVAGERLSQLADDRPAAEEPDDRCRQFLRHGGSGLLPHCTRIGNRATAEIQSTA